MSALRMDMHTLWIALPYQAYGICVRCGEHAYCCGHYPGGRICLSCFSAKGKAPRWRLISSAPLGSENNPDEGIYE